MNLTIREQILNDRWLLISLDYSNSFLAISIISLIGFCLNSICFVSFLKPTFNQRDKFKYILVKLILETLSCLIGTGLHNLICSLKCSINLSYPFQILKLVLNYFTEAIFIITGLIEICLAYERFLLLKNKHNWFNKNQNFKFITIGCFLAPIVCLIPNVFAFKIKVLNETAHIELTQFQNSISYTYVLISVWIIDLLLIIAQTVISLAVVVAFRKFNNYKIMHQPRLTAILVLKASAHKSCRSMLRSSRIRKNEVKFIQMILTQSFLFILVRLVYLVTISLDCIEILRKFYDRTSNVNLSKLWFVIAYLVQGSNFIVLFYFNRTFRRFLHFKLCCNVK